MNLTKIEEIFSNSSKTLKKKQKALKSLVQKEFQNCSTKPISIIFRQNLSCRAMCHISKNRVYLDKPFLFKSNIPNHLRAKMFVYLILHEKSHFLVRIEEDKGDISFEAMMFNIFTLGHCPRFWEIFDNLMVDYRMFVTPHGFAYFEFDGEGYETVYVNVSAYRNKI